MENTASETKYSKLDTILAMFAGDEPEQLVDRHNETFEEDMPEGCDECMTFPCSCDCGDEVGL